MRARLGKNRFSSRVPLGIVFLRSVIFFLSLRIQFANWLWQSAFPYRSTTSQIVLENGLPRRSAPRNDAGMFHNPPDSFRGISFTKIDFSFRVLYDRETSAKEDENP